MTLTTLDTDEGQKPFRARKSFAGSITEPKKLVELVNKPQSMTNVNGERKIGSRNNSFINGSPNKHMGTSSPALNYSSYQQAKVESTFSAMTSTSFQVRQSICKWLLF